jgi:lipopolysaccharide/colanic/teichoic acid biosynthesis glycosyltransferase
MRVEGGRAAAVVELPSSPGDTASRSKEQARVRLEAANEAARRNEAALRSDADLLPRDVFMRDVRRERLRADRSGSPLSIVVFSVPQAHGHASATADLGTLLDVLHARTRETDSIGHLGHERIALLCPDTDAGGAEELSLKIAHALTPLVCASERATYPGALFDDLVQGGALKPLTTPFVESDGRKAYAAKRAIDIVVASLMLVLLSPLMLLVAAAISITSRGPVIFKQKRLGQGGVPFTFYKFRSMVVDGDDSIHRKYIEQHIKHDAAAAALTDAVPYKVSKDPRITRIGRFIRKTSIDELPQLFNILRGDMSLVGPRPPIPYEARHYQSWHLRRITSVKPGLTGLWQVEGRGRVSFNEMVRLDLRYIRDCSMVLDLKILAKTVLVVVRCLGAV